MKKRKICVVVYSRANYGRIKSFMQAVKESKVLKLQVIIGASALLSRFGEVINVIKKDGFKPNAVIYSIVEGENPVTMAKSAGLATVELATHLENLKPDVVLTVADRYETISTAIAASYMNIVVAHTQGGEVSGSIDENVRHAITKLSHIHFPATKRAKEFLLKMGEQKSSVFLTGCPSFDIIDKKNLKITNQILEKYKGVGANLDCTKPYVVCLQHPVTTEFGSGLSQINETLFAVKKVSIEKNFNVIWLWPNVDAGSDDISKGIRKFREKFNPKNIHFYRNFSPEDYLSLIFNSKCLIGNSSSGIRESSYLGIPVVNIGSRQENRERSDNVIDVGYDRSEIEKAILQQLQMKSKYKPVKLYGDGTAGKKMVKILEKIDLSNKKKLNYLT